MESILSHSIQIFTTYRQNVDKALNNLSRHDFYYTPDKDSNSIAIIMKHMSGNMISRWTDFLTTDGEKPNRNRDAEFEVQPEEHEKLLLQWQQGWQTLFDTLNSLSESDLAKMVTIRQEPHSVLQALLRQIAHYSYHCGQIIYVAKIIKGESWQSLSIPKGKSDDFNNTMNTKFSK